MSPEHSQINSVPASIRKQLRSLLGENYDSLVQTRDIYFLLDEDRVTSVLTDSISERIAKNARKKNSPWNIVHPLCDPNKVPSVIFSQTDCEGEIRNNYSPKYRGNHRSHTRGAGGFARDRMSESARNKGR